MKNIILFLIFLFVSVWLYFNNKHDCSKHDECNKTNEQVKIINYNGEIGYLIPVDKLKDHIKIDTE